MQKNGRLIVAGAVVIFLTIAAGAYLHLQEFSRTPAAESGEEQSFTVEPGQSVASVAEGLERRGLIHSAFKFRLISRLEGYDRRLKAGEYGLTPSQTPLEILTLMEKGWVRLHRLMIPEGLTIPQIAALVEKSGLARAEDIIARATDPAYVRLQDIPADTLEGYLFPETYFFPKTVGVEGILAAMLQRFRLNFPPDWERKQRKLA